MGLQCPISELFQNAFDVALLFHGNGASPPISLKMNFKKGMQLAEVTHFEFVLKARLQLVDHIHITCQNYEFVYTHDYNHNVVVNLQNIQRMIRMTPRKTFVYKEYVNAFVPCF